MATPPRLKKLTLSGFRAYLSEQNIDFGKSGNSLVVAAPNGKGKSSLVDAIEFLFSKEGLVERLGKVRSGTQAGKDALVHHAAVKANIAPFVKAEFVGSAQIQPFTRSAKAPEVLPADLATVLGAKKVDFIIRGFELRKFVEATTPADRYESVSNWFGFNQLLKTQDALRNLRLQLSSALNDSSQLNIIHGDVQKLTNRLEQQWNETRCLTWFNTAILAPLDPVLKALALDSCSGIKKVLFDRAAEAATSTSSALNKTITEKIKVLHGDQSAASPVIGTFAVCNTALEALKKAQFIFDQTKSQSEKAVFADVWREAEVLLKKPSLKIDNCPVCETPIEQTSAKSVDGIKVTLANSLSQLATYHDAEKSLKSAKSAAENKVRETKEALTSVLGLLNQITHSVDLQPIHHAVNTCEGYTYNGEPIDFESARAALQGLAEHLAPAIPKSQEAGKPTWKLAHDTLEKLVSFKERADYEERRKSEVQKIHDSVVAYAGAVDAAVKSYVEKLIATLTDKINFFYKEIQTGIDSVPAIHLSFPSDAKKKVQAQLDLLIDFAESRKSVPPSGYLSDSQVHTLALAIRLASICMFNRGFPIIVLDDIVTSYDADRRKAVVNLIANHLTDYQVLVMTHDEQFYRFLEDQLAPSKWRFKRIARLDKTFGPRYSDHQILDQEIEELHQGEHSAANLIRNAEEEWLSRIGRDFGVNTRMRELGKEHSHQRHELALALHTFLESRNLFPPVISGHQNPFLLSLQRGLIENFGSHFQDDPHSWGSVGDEKIRWQNFKEFREKFACPSCKGRRFKRPDSLNKPVCKTQNCEQPFAFV